MYAIIIISFFLILIIYLLYFKHNSNIIKRIQYNDKVVILIVRDSVSEGLPHTTDKNTIIIQDSIFNSPRYKNTLTHELVHISQKQEPQKWYDFYEKYWFYKPYRNLGFDIRPNPDTSDTPYMIWKDRFVFVPLYNSERTLRNSEIRVWDVEIQDWVDIPAEWKYFFCEDYNLQQYEHPHEIAAEYITNKVNTRAAKLLYDWKNRNGIYDG